jgi:hypothetical protein
LFEKWAPYKAAFTTINTVTSSSALDHANALRSLKIPSGLLSIERFNQYSSLIFDYNKHLQWMVLHCGEGKLEQEKV